MVFTQLQMDEQPQFDVYLKPGRKDVLKVGDTAVFYVDIFTPVDSVASYQLDVTTPNNTLSICRNRVFTTGYNIPCFGNDIDATYLSFEEDGHRDRALLDLGIVRNTGESSQFKIQYTQRGGRERGGGRGGQESGLMREVQVEPAGST